MNTDPTGLFDGHIDGAMDNGCPCRACAFTRVAERESVPGDCPVCNSFDDDLSWRDGICETCYIEQTY